jgi:3'-5' exoribonuclease
MKVLVKDLQKGQELHCEFLLTDSRSGKTKRNTDFLNCRLGDKSGDVVAVWWDYDAQPRPVGIYTITGTVGEYRDAPQIVIKSITPRTSGRESEEQFRKVSKYDVEGMWDTITTEIALIDSYHVRTVLQDIVLNQGFDEAFKTFPAAMRVHHAFDSGILEHTSQMVEITKKIFDLGFISEALNRDLCMFGIILHDFGKIFEYSKGQGYPITVQGVLVPHIPMTAALIFETSNRFGVPEIIRDHMMHVVLAHHGKLEYGSPVKMATPEAMFVHFIDHMHGDIYGAIQKMDTTKEATVQQTGSTVLTERFSDTLKKVELAISQEVPL